MCLRICCSTVSSWIQADVDFTDPTNISPSHAPNLLEFVLRSTYFMYNGNFYEQLEGVAMGSPVSAIIFNLFMENFEQQALGSCPPEYVSRSWKRYVDDTFIVSTRSTVNNLVLNMNSQQQINHITMEVENNNQIVFLDTLVHRDTSNHLVTTVCRKPTHTDQYLAPDSHHPEYVKSGVVGCLYDRASNIVTKPRHTAAEKQHIQSALMSNGYSKSFIQRIVKTKRRSTKTFTEYRATAFLPFIDEVSHQLRRRPESQGIGSVFSSNATIRNHLVHPKDPPFQTDVTELCIGFLSEFVIRCT